MPIRLGSVAKLEGEGEARAKEHEGRPCARLVGCRSHRLQVLHQRKKPEACGLDSRNESLLDRSRSEVLRIQVGHDLMDRLPTGGVAAPRLPYPARHFQLILCPRGRQAVLVAGLLSPSKMFRRDLSSASPLKGTPC